MMKSFDNETNDGKTTYVGIGEIVIGYENDILKISSLGSCIGLVLYPKPGSFHQKIAIMGHIMLPKSPSKDAKPTGRKWGPAKYADVAVHTMVVRLKEIGVYRETILAKMVGGAKMFGHGSKTLQIGKNNARETKRNLAELYIPIQRSFTGGDTGMSVIYNISSSSLIVRTTGGEPMRL
jgi:chemotaxis protein CheD